MSTVQNNDLRFMKRRALEEEARIIGNYYSDLIHNYGLDCIYHKLNTNVFGNFKGIVDQNTILQHAYGQNIMPDYTCSAEMVVFPEIQSDIFQLQKYGIIPQTEIDFYFDSKQFACDLASKCGQLKEYAIETEVIFEELSPLEDNYTLDTEYSCGVLEGNLSVVIENCITEEKTVVVDPYQHSKFIIDFPKNSDLYKSLSYSISNSEYIETLIYFKYQIFEEETEIEGELVTKRFLSGTIFGSVLFYDLNKLGKYIEMIHPEVGDIIIIDFPDESNREAYEITDCYDKSLQSDGISPLLHKYIWKCKGKRRVDTYDFDQENEADKQIEEKIKYEQVVDEVITKKISLYDEGDQEAYGGYDSVIESYDSKKINEKTKHITYEHLDDGTCLDIFTFGIGAKLVTDGYDLIFITAPNIDGKTEAYVVSKSSVEVDKTSTTFESGLKWLKASNEKIVFVNILGEANSLVEDELATQNEIQLCLDDLNEKTLDTIPVNEENDNFVKFSGTRSYLWSDGEHLFAKLQSNKGLYKLI